MQHGQVVDEVNVTSLGGKLELGGPGNSLYGIQSFNLLGVEGGQATLARVSS